MQISTRVFSGEMPKLAKRNLPGNYAVSAIDCELTSEELRSIRNNKVINAAPAGTKTTYEFSNRFIHFANDVDVAEHPGANALDRLFVTGDGVPRQTDINTNGTVFYNMGIPKPNAPTIVSNSSDLSGDIYDTLYVTTYVNGYGEEGDKSEPSPTIQREDGAVIVLGNVGTGNSSGLAAYNVQAMRIYRLAETGGLKYLTEIPLSTAQYIDTIKDEVHSAQELFSTEDFFPPPAGGRGLHIMSNGIALMFVGRDVYVSEPFQPNAWPYSFTVNSKVVAISSFDNTAVILTEGYPELATIFDPRNINNAPLADREPCVSKRGVVQGDEGVMYPSPGGFYFIGVSGGQMLTRETHDEDDWRALSPHTFTAAYRDGQYIAFYGTAEFGGGWIYDTREPNAVIRRLSQWASSVYVVEGTDDLYMVTSNGTLELYQGGVDRVDHFYESKEYGDGPPVALNSRRLLAKEFANNLDAEQSAAYDEARLALMRENAAILAVRSQLGRLYGYGGALGQDTFGGCGSTSLTGGITLERGVTFAGDALQAVPPAYEDIEFGEVLKIYGDGDLVHEEKIISNEPDRTTFAERHRCWHYTLKGTTTIQQCDIASSISAMGGY